MNKRKIRIMTALAIYDARFGKADNDSDDYYKKDYIYKKNSETRIGVFLGACVIYFLRLIKLMAEGVIENAIINLKAEFIGFVVFAVALMAAYSVVGYFIYSKEYEDTQSRLTNYYALLDRLAEIEAAEKSDGLTDDVEKIRA